MPHASHDNMMQNCTSNHKAFTSTRWRFDARLSNTKANSPICAKDIPTYRIHDPSFPVTKTIEIHNKRQKLWFK